MLSTFPGFLKSFCFQSVFVLCFFHFFSSVLFYSYCCFNLHPPHCSVSVEQLKKSHVAGISTVETCLAGSTYVEYAYNLQSRISTPRYMSNRNAQICAQGLCACTEAHF